MQPWMNDMAKAVVETKRDLRWRIPDLKERFAALSAWAEREVGAVVEERGQGSVIPELRYQDLAAGEVPPAVAARIRRRGCAIVRGVFSKAQAAAWNDGIGEYIERNAYQAKVEKKAGLDRYFASLAAGNPQIFQLYWSRPQMEARQSEALARTRAALNRLWKHEGAFDPDRECLYADRLRRRTPGDRTLGLSPHADGGSVERWCDPGYQRVYADVLFGDPARYNPFDGAHRVHTEEIPSPAVCSVFRTYQGWTGLTRQGAGDGTLQLAPIAGLMGWLLLRALQDDVPEGELCGAKGGTALPMDERWHALAWPAMTSLPVVDAGDTVWWHCDLIHAVEPEHRGTSSSNVVYIAAAPWCEKNASFLPRQLQAFREGRSGPDFAPHDLEVDFAGRATVDDLTPLGRQQMGAETW